MDQTQLNDRLRRGILTDVKFERVLSTFRRGFLEGRASENLPFMVSLACQCFNNEYVYPVSEDEKRAILSLKERFTKVRDLIVYAMYEPLGTVRESALRFGLDRNPDTIELFSRQILEPAEEAEIKKTILSFGVSADPISRVVREQYEESPYPRWIDLALPKPLTFREAMRDRFPNVSFPELGNPLSILVAGCGTGFHPITTAALYSDAQVTAIDFSKASLAFAIRQARRYDLRNLHFLHGDILDLNADQKFDAIEAVGVLHHMADPAAGLQILVRALKPGGFIKLGLYSRRARANFKEAYDLVGKRTKGGSPNELRELRQEIIRHSAGTKNGPMDFIDFYYTSGFRDLLCHASEVSYHPADLKPILDEAGLIMLGYRGIDPPLRTKYLETFPQDPYIRDLDLVDAFEAVNPNFLNLQIFWAQRK